MIKHSFEVITKLGKIPVFVESHIDQAIVEKVRGCKKFSDYLEKINKCPEGVQVGKIELLSVQMFGDKVGFISMRAVTKQNGFGLPSFVFVRGGAVGILVLVNKRLLLIRQYRVPVQEQLWEAPAGMLDESGDFVGVAAKEVEEETSIKLQKNNLISLGTFYTSPGGSDEEIHLYYAQIEMQKQKMEAIEQKIHGCEHEKIKVKFVDYNPSFILQSKSSILIALAYAYQNAKNKKQQ